LCHLLIKKKTGREGERENREKEKKEERNKEREGVSVRKKER